MRLSNKTPMQVAKKIADKLFSTSAAGLYMIVFAIAIAAATFIENDFGASSAQKLVFKAWWFELILLLFVLSLLVNIFRYRMVQQKKWPVLSFHLAMIVIVIGAGVTRYFGSEGMMHIREGSSGNSFLSAETYLIFEATRQGKTYKFDEPVLFATLGNNHFKESYLLGNDKVEVEVLGFMPNPTEVLQSDAGGMPILKVVAGGQQGREEYFVKYKEPATIHGLTFNFGDAGIPGAINIRYDNDRLFVSADQALTQMQMATQTIDTLAPGVEHPLILRSLYAAGSQNFVVGDFNPAARLEVASSDRKMSSNSMAALDMKVSVNGQEQRFYLFGMQGVEGRPRVLAFGDISFSIAYGAKRVQLPFSIALRDFIMERYPGTNSASSYASEVTLIDPRKNLERNSRIYMNNILNYGGYRFFQSSYDQDELGTYLSVNHDAPGAWISYIGYFILTIGMLLTLLQNNSRFRKLGESIKKMRGARQTTTAVIILTMTTLAASAQPSATVTPAHADAFGRLLMQDHMGRMKPMNTFSNEVLRKLSKKENLFGLNADQIVLGMAANPDDWYAVPLIKMGKHEEVKKILNTNAPLISYRDFFDAKGEYLLQDYVRNAYNMPQRDRGALEKEILKLDEKVNICMMIFSGSFMKMFPIPGDKNNSWEAPAEGGQHQHDHANESVAQRFYEAYIPTLQGAMQSGDWSTADELVKELGNYQQKNGGAILPSATKVKAELFYNKAHLFGKLDAFYGMLGFAMLVLLFLSVFRPSTNLVWPQRIALGLLAAAFVLHTLGLGLRWYISGRAPWSNGYESMIYIGWTTVLAGLVFARKSLGGLTATNVLAAVILMVAGLSFLDPEITPLVPVLKSYWLTIHVSMVAGSYGFLMLGAIIGVLNLVFMVFANVRNGQNVDRIIKEMTAISEMTLIGGLMMLSIGTYLGGIWANESWGRYWGWDAKETWALVTILVYAFILHMRLIPGLRGVYAFNLASLFGWASVMMTYFGVNYYLSGLHSYAAGDPLPIPPAVYYTVVSLTVISVLAYLRYRKRVGV